MSARERPVGQHEPSGEPASAPRVINQRYQVERLLGQGGLGSVYAVHDKVSGHALALKRLAGGSTPQTRALFEREFQTSSELRHPNIVEVYDYGIDVEGPYYTMELVTGGELTREAPMAWRSACLCLRDVAAILEFLHARRLLHRDLSPRNLLRTANGRIKLIDFTGLAPLGPVFEVVGAPPFVPPEALAGAPLDARSDLFALGALGYWLLASVHAYPARNLAELARLHELAPMLASQATIIKRGARAGVVPDELDALLAALLSRSPDQRPRSAAVVIDKLNTIAELTPEANEQSMRSYLDSNVFVGRTEEIGRILATLSRAKKGSGRSVLVDCAPGLGRTRMLQQLSVLSRLHGSLALRADARHGQRPFAAAADLALALLTALPFEARAAAEPFAAQLGQLSEAVREQLRPDNDTHTEPKRAAPTTANTLAEQRIAVQVALRGWLQTLSKARCIAILVDDFHALDEESRSALVTLADGISSARMLLVVTTSSAASVSPALITLRSLSADLTLPALSRDETVELMRSVFGDVPNLERCVERLWRASAGNPSYCLELAQQLVRVGLARYVEGTWMLPAELDDVPLARTHEEAQLARVARVSPPARALAELLSIPHDEPLELSTCCSLSEFGPAETESVLGELVREGVLVHHGGGYAFVHASTQHSLCAALLPERFAHAQLALGRVLERRPHRDGLLSLRASLHLLHGGEVETGLALLREATAFYAARSPEAVASFVHAAPLFEDAHVLLSAKNADDHTQAPLLGMLALASHFVDRRYEARYGEAIIATYERVLRLELARRLARFVGGRIALLIALSVAFFSMRHKPRRAALRSTVNDFARSASALASTAAALVDAARAHRYADALAPFRAWGKQHLLYVVHELASALATLVEDRVGSSATRLKALLTRLERGERLRDVRDEVREDLITSCYLGLGVLACWQDGPEALRIADRIEKLGPLHAMSAEDFRSHYYTNMGDLRRAQHHRQRIEVQAAQLGSTWQVELWVPMGAAKMALRLADPLVIRRSFQALARLAEELPSMAREARRARGIYLMLIGKYEQAVVLLDSSEPPLLSLGWTLTRGALARAHNGLRQHARAKEVCEAALRLSERADFQYPVVRLNTQIELALAEAGLGEHQRARALLDELLREHAPHHGVLTMGSLHEARAWVELGAGDFAACREHLTKMDSWYRPSGAASLLERIGALVRALREAEGGSGAVSAEGGSAARVEGQLARLSKRLDASATSGFMPLAQSVLQSALELTSASDAFLFMPGAPVGAFVLLGGGAPSDVLKQWATRALAGSNQDEKSVIDSDEEANDRMTLRLADKRYLAADLRHELGIGVAFGLLCLGFTGEPRPLHADVLRLLAERLEAVRPPQPAVPGASPRLSVLTTTLRGTSAGAG